MAVFHSARKSERKVLLDFFDRLARTPSTQSDWVVRDSTGRANYQMAVGRFLVTFWTDDSAREIRVVRIDRID